MYNSIGKKDMEFPCQDKEVQNCMVSLGEKQLSSRSKRSEKCKTLKINGLATQIQDGKVASTHYDKQKRICSLTS